MVCLISADKSLYTLLLISWFTSWVIGASWIRYDRYVVSMLNYGPVLQY